MAEACAYEAFLSSGFSDQGDLRPIREETRTLFEAQDLGLWTWEHWSTTPEGKEFLGGHIASPPPVFAQIAAFRRALIDSRIFILFVATRRGSQIEPWDDTLRTYGTFLELEVYFAIALRKPIIVLREEGAHLEAPLEDLLRVARQSGTLHHEEKIARRELPQRSLAAFRGVEADLRARSARFITLLAIRREPKLDFRETMPFLFGLSLPPIQDRRPHPDFDVIDRLLKEEETLALTMSEKLSRLWLAIQEILPGRRRMLLDPELADRWLRCLDRWSAAASWFGLHAHLGVSPFTAHAERARLIEKLPSPHRLMPFGPLASARYSIGRREAFGLRRRREFATVVEHVKSALDLGKGDRAGYLSIMGHALMQNGRLFAAQSAFEESLRIRRAESNDPRIGEGMADLGFILFLTLRLGRGIRLMEEGIATLEEAGNTEFLLKSMKKLELAYRLRGRGNGAKALRARRTALAVRSEAFDQI